MHVCSILIKPTVLVIKYHTVQHKHFQLIPSIKTPSWWIFGSGRTDGWTEGSSLSIRDDTDDKRILFLVKATINLKYRFSQDEEFPVTFKGRKKIILLILDASCFKIRVDLRSAGFWEASWSGSTLLLGIHVKHVNHWNLAIESH